MKKYEPKTVNDLIFANPSDKRRVEQYATVKRHGNILLYGPKGTAKSTTARIICEAVNALTNVPDEPTVYRSSQITEQDFSAFENEFNWQRLQGSLQPLIIIEEADEMSRVMQKKFRGFLDSNQLGHCILTTNHINQLDAPLVDRCDAIEMPFLSVEDVMPKATQIIRAEGKTIQQAALRQLLSAGDGSIRQMMRNVEDYVLV